MLQGLPQSEHIKDVRSALNVDVSIFFNPFWSSILLSCMVATSIREQFGECLAAGGQPQSI